jgi:hypothetical protein
MAGELTFVLIGEKMNLGPSHQCSICLYGIMAKLLPKQKLDLSLLVYLGGQVYIFTPLDVLQSCSVHLLSPISSLSTDIGTQCA